MPEIVAVTTDFGNLPSPLVRHHVSYYAPSIDRYVLVIHNLSASEYAASLRMVLPQNVIVYHATHLPQVTLRAENRLDARKDHYEEAALDAIGIEPEAFVLRLDLDEFHVYPAPIRDLVSLMERRNKNAVLGYFRDRIRFDETGSRVMLADVERDLGATFPMCMTYARDMMNPPPCEEKIMISRRSVLLGYGRHHIRRPNGPIEDRGATTAAKCWADLNPRWGGDHFYVHHFRWTRRLVDTIKSRPDPAEYGAPYRNELASLRDLFEEPNYLRFDWGKVRCRAGHWTLPRHGLSYW